MGGPTVLTQGSASVGVEDGQGGLTLRYSPSLMEGVRREALDKVRNPDAPTPKSDAVEELKARRMAEYLSFAPVMQRDLEQCKLLGEESVTLHGKPARMLRFSANPSLPASIKKLLDRLDTDVRIWIGTDGTPLASEVKLHLQGKPLLHEFQRKSSGAPGLHGAPAKPAGEPPGLGRGLPGFRPEVRNPPPLQGHRELTTFRTQAGITVPSDWGVAVAAAAGSGQVEGVGIHECMDKDRLDGPFPQGEGCPGVETPATVESAQELLGRS